MEVHGLVWSTKLHGQPSCMGVLCWTNYGTLPRACQSKQYLPLKDNTLNQRFIDSKEILINKVSDVIRAFAPKQYTCF